jgi:dynein heavy chain, axonemal
LFKLYLEESIEFLRRNIKEPLPTVNNNLLCSLMKIFDCYLVDYTESELKKIPVEDLEVLEKVIDPIFMFSLIWSVGCTGDAEGRLKFSEFIV